MNKKYFPIIAVLAALAILMMVRFSTLEDDWICQNGEWVKHGNPDQPMPTTLCGEVTPVDLANPASVNCQKQGGALKIEKRPDGGEFGVCYFEDNRQCEEWAMFRGQCPVGGLKVTGYVSPAARYCAITGGQYQFIRSTGELSEQGICNLAENEQCDVDEYYSGRCPLNDTNGH